MRAKGRPEGKYLDQRRGKGGQNFVLRRGQKEKKLEEKRLKER